MFQKEQILKVKQSIDIEQFLIDILGKDCLIERYNRFDMCCPFHDDKSPSFSFFKESGLWKCWTEGISGDIIAFYQRYFGKSFNDTILELAEKYDINIELSEEYKKQQKIKKAVYVMNEVVAKTYTSNILKSQDAINYLKKRKFDSNTVKKFQIGYASDTKLESIFPKYKNALIHSNLIYENGNNYFQDRRITIPFHDEYGNVVGFSSRAIDEDVKPKYLHSRQSEIFNKSELLFGLNFAKEEIKNRKSVIMTEGQIDTIRAHQFGFYNTVAVCGNALTDDNINKLKSLKCFTYYIVVEDEKFEKDRLDATYEKIKSQNYWANIKIIKLYDKDKCDLDEFLLTYGKSAFYDKIKNAKLYNAYKLDYLISNITYKKLEDKKGIVYNARHYINKIDNIIDKKQYIELISNQLELPINDIYNILYKANNEDKIVVGNYDNRIILSQKMLISTLFSKFSKTREDIFETYSILEKNNIEEYLNDDFKNLYNKIINCCLQNNESNDIISLLYIEEQDNLKFLNLLNDCYFKSEDLDNLDDYEELEEFIVDMLENLK